MANLIHPKIGLHTDRRAADNELVRFGEIAEFRRR